MCAAPMITHENISFFNIEQASLQPFSDSSQPTPLASGGNVYSPSHIFRARARACLVQEQRTMVSLIGALCQNRRAALTFSREQLLGPLDAAQADVDELILRLELEELQSHFEAELAQQPQ